VAYFDTDKLTLHGYFQVYARIAGELGPDVRVLELGVKDGESLRMFQSLFPLGEVTGVDCDHDATWPEGTVRVVTGQDDPGLPALAGGGPFGLVVDDASHDGELTRKSFDLLWPLVRPGGYYVVEDWTVALRDDPQWGRSWGPGMLRAAESFLPMLAWRDGECDFITYRYGLIILHKNEAPAAPDWVLL